MIKIDRLETSYNYVLNRIFNLANPIKKSVKKTECKVHIFLNAHAIDILLEGKHLKEYNLFKSYIWSINEGVVWADQDFKSSSHFYNPDKRRGLYGRKNAKELATEYYRKSINLWKYGDKKLAMLYLGASVHIVQDMTVPQHANIKLLDDHYQYENYVKKTYQSLIGFNEEKKPYILDSIADYIRFNSRVSLKVYRRFKHVKEDECRFYKTLRCTLPIAKRTTAGVFLMFYKDITEDAGY
ncbi:zinc dependent phospholipase C family protein [Tissierella sp. Yu-01]|uniref:zinc dependent phospholipase C family protein n=1 Tax=Tissierella sp. Yu-01 TaxID=3035694 RepID=UPI00240E7A11|nr:zinc dependent phospholipase C family protein [Tissierella sp. Yu-01]WFA09348.1 zinc dependent phospholipase C family protein [Tissierella sp. Yu-01]